MSALSLVGIDCDFSNAFKSVLLVNLKEFTYQNSERDIFDPAILQLAAAMPYVTSINFSGTKLTNSNLKILLQKCKQVDEISILNSKLMSDFTF